MLEEPHVLFQQSRRGQWLVRVFDSTVFCNNQMASLAGDGDLTLSFSSSLQATAGTSACSLVPLETIVLFIHDVKDKVGFLPGPCRNSFPYMRGFPQRTSMGQNQNAMMDASVRRATHSIALADGGWGPFVEQDCVLLGYRV